MAQRWKVGEKIKGKYDEYEVYKVLGGGMGDVYICYAIKQGLPVALKTFQERFFASKEHQEMARREILIWVELERHPYIVRAYYVEEVGGQLFIVLEYVVPDKEGRNTLTHYLREVSLTDSLKFAIQFCYGIEHAYSKGIKAHRDIKPDNIMVTQNKTVKIIDFGLATVLDRTEIEEKAEGRGQKAEGMGLSVFQSEGGRVAGTLPYMAPEQFEGKADRKSDIYSFGIVLYQMASEGKLPFVGRTWDEYYSLQKSGRIPSIKSPLFFTIEKCMRRKMPEFDSFTLLRKELEELFYRETGEKIQPPKVEELEAWELGNKGLALAVLGRYNEAIVCYDKVLEINTKDALAWNNKGLALNKLSRLHESIAHYDKALEINPRDALVWNNKGLVLDKLGRLNEAVMHYDKALEINSRLAEAWNNKGNALAKLGKHNEVIICYDKALEINSRDALAWMNKGLALAMLGKLQEAIDCWNKALEINPRDALTWYNKGNVLADLGRYNEAIACYDKALELNPKDALAWMNKGNALDKLGHHQDAITCYDKALDLNSRFALAWYHKGLALADLGRYSKAITCHDKALEIDPMYAEALFNKGLVLANLGRYNEAIACYDKALELNPRYVEAWLNKGATLDKSGSPNEAIACYDKALELNPRLLRHGLTKGLLWINQADLIIRQLPVGIKHQSEIQGILSHGITNSTTGIINSTTKG